MSKKHAKSVDAAVDSLGLGRLRSEGLRGCGVNKAPARFSAAWRCLPEAVKIWSEATAPATRKRSSADTRPAKPIGDGRWVLTTPTRPFRRQRRAGVSNVAVELCRSERLRCACEQTVILRLLTTHYAFYHRLQISSTP